MHGHFHFLVVSQIAEKFISLSAREQCPRFSIRMVIEIFYSDTQYLSNSTNIHE